MSNVPAPDEHGHWTRTTSDGLHYHADDPATEVAAQETTPVDVEEMDDYRDVWGFIRSVAYGWPLKTAPAHVWRIHIAAISQVAKGMLAVHEADEKAKATTNAGDESERQRLLREVAELVACDPIADDEFGHHCVFCSWADENFNAEPEHDTDCAVLKAQAALATDEASANAEK